MHPYVIGLAGGSGSGKSTLAFGLEDAFPDRVLVFHIDDYFRPEAEVPIQEGLVNWDDPEALFHEKMVKDLAALKAGKAAVIYTKSPRHNPDFLKTGQRIPVEFQPKPLIVVEGFLTLHFPGIRQLLDLAIYLDGPFELHSSRRVHGKLHNFPTDYNEKILKPMHEKYVQPSKIYADKVLDAAALSQQEIKEATIALIKQKTDL